MDVQELEGAELDAAVARARGLKTLLVDGRCIVDLPYDSLIGPDFYAYEPTKNWAQGGPIIERERIELLSYEPGKWEAQVEDGSFTYIDQHQGEAMEGPTPLIAAMRAFVAKAAAS